MTYIVNYTDDGKTPILVGNTELNTDTSLKLIGKRYSGYGEIIAENFLHLLENFSDTTPPSNPIEGQLWYNPNTENISVYTSSGNWRTILSSSGTQIDINTTQFETDILGTVFDGAFFSNDNQLKRRSAFRSPGRIAIGDSYNHNLATDGNVTGGSFLQSFTALDPENSGTQTIEDWDYAEDQSLIFGSWNNGRNTFGFGSQTINNGGATYTGIILHNNASSTNTKGGALYVDAIRNNQSAGDTISLEVNVANLGGTVTAPTPYAEPLNRIVSPLRLAIGSDPSIFNGSYAAGAFQNFINNGSKAHAGIVVEFNAILREGELDTPATNKVGVGTGFGAFAKLPHNIGIEWFSSLPLTTPGTQQGVVRLSSEVTNPNKKWRTTWTNDAFFIGDNVTPAWNYFIVEYNESAINGVKITPSEVGLAPLISPAGFDTNINLSLDGKGTGNVAILKNLLIDDKIIHIGDGGVGDPGTSIRFPENGNISFETNSGERVRITETGLVGIGTTDPQNILHIQTSIGATANILRIDTGTPAVGNPYFYIRKKSATEFMIGGLDGTNAEGLLELSFPSGVKTSSITSVVDDGIVAIFNRLTSDGKVVQFKKDGTDIGDISIATGQVNYNQTSDYRLKENIVPLTDATERLLQIPVRRFNFITSPDKTVDGFIAHELQVIIPEAVSGNKDEIDENNNPVYQGVDQSKVVPLLTAALQEAINKIKELETNNQKWISYDTTGTEPVSRVQNNVYINNTSRPITVAITLDYTSIEYTTLEEIYEYDEFKVKSESEWITLAKFNGTYNKVYNQTFTIPPNTQYILNCGNNINVKWSELR